MTASTTVGLTQIDEAVTEIVEKHKPLLEFLRMSSADRWVALDGEISNAARDNHTTKKDVMVRIGRAMEKESPEGYARSLKVMISRAKSKKGTAKNPQGRKKGFEALFEKLDKMELTEEQLERLFILLEGKKGRLGYNQRDRLQIHRWPVQAEGVNNLLTYVPCKKFKAEPAILQ